jgi:hypothetical protein
MATLLKVLDKAVDPTAMDDATATRLGLKSYSHGTTYNGGIAPTLAGPAGFAIQFSRFMPYQMLDGKWRLRFSWAMTMTGTANCDTTLNGILTPAFLQPVTLQQTASAAITTGLVYLEQNSVTGLFTLRYASSVTAVGVCGDVELLSKPTWAY